MVHEFKIVKSVINFIEPTLNTVIVGAIILRGA